MQEAFLKKTFVPPKVLLLGKSSSLMHAITLPDELHLDATQSVQLFDYKSSKELAKQQIILNHNTFSFLIEGTKEVIFDHSTLSIDNSQFILMKAGHCLMTERLSPIDNYRSMLLFFTNETLLQFTRKIDLNKSETKEYKSVYSFMHDEFIGRFVDSLVDIATFSKSVQNKLLEVKFEEIMWYLIERYGSHFLYSLIARSSDDTQRFIQTIESNLFNKLTLKELAFLNGMSISTFKRVFEKNYGESPSKWFQNKRLEHAHYLLNQQEKTSSEIYFEVGYENLSSFIQAYKLKYGITPKQHHKK